MNIGGMIDEIENELKIDSQEKEKESKTAIDDDWGNITPVN